MIGDLIAAYASWLVSGAVAALAFVAGWNHYRAML